MQNRTYVFAVSALSAFLTIVAFIKPDVSSTISQATITVPQEMSQLGLDPIVERVRSIEFLRQAGQRHGIADGDTSSQAATIVDDWAQGVQVALDLEEQTSTATNAVDIVLKYRGLDGSHSISVMESLLTALREEAQDEESSLLTPEAQLRKTAAEQQLERAKVARQHFVDEELARLREEHRIGIERQIPVSIERDADSETHDSFGLPTPVGVAKPVVELSAPASKNDGNGPADWLAAQKRIDEENQLIRNPEFDVLVRALVRAQAERQELLTQFSASHSAVRRVEVEIGRLGLLVSHTEKYLKDDAEALRPESSSEESSLGDETLVSRIHDDLGSFDESAAIASIRQSETYQSFDREVRRAEQELTNITASTGTSSNPQRVVVSQPPELLQRTLVGLAWPRLLTIGAISALIGFVVSRLGDSAAVPTVFYSIADVHRSLRIPVVGQLAMDNTPVVPHPESITRGRFWQQLVRGGELAAVMLIGGFVFAAFLRPEILGDLFSNPVTAYVHALYELRIHVPVPYLFQ